MDQTLELRSQGHVDDDRGQTEHEPNLTGAVRQVLRFPFPRMQGARRQIFQERLNLLHHHTNGSAARRGRDAGAAESTVVADGIGGRAGRSSY